MRNLLHPASLDRGELTLPPLSIHRMVSTLGKGQDCSPKDQLGVVCPPTGERFIQRDARWSWQQWPLLSSPLDTPLSSLSPWPHSPGNTGVLAWAVPSAVQAGSGSSGSLRAEGVPMTALLISGQLVDSCHSSQPGAESWFSGLLSLTPGLHLLSSSVTLT